ncbi:MAG: hypothetical protein JNL88_04835, partial [Bacteroidia bacterium]|nr:hypothetical protein [Bacteroidia bacterium]
MKSMIRSLFFLFLLAGAESRAVVYYSNTSGGNWNDAASWSTSGYGMGTNTGTFPKSGDYAYIGDGYTIVINVACTTSYLIIGQGSSGILEYSDAGAYTCTVINNLTVNPGAIFRYTGNSTRTHTLQVGNNISNSGSISFYSDANDVVNLVFYRSAHSVVSGSGSFALNTVTVQKSTATSYLVEVQSTTFESGIRDLVLTYGTYYHNNSSTYEVNSGGAAFTIPADGVIRVNQGILHLSPAQDLVNLHGSITVNGGTLRIGASTGNGGLRYERLVSFVPRMDIQGGTVEVYGGITHKSGAPTSPFIFSMSNGNLKLNTGTTGTAETVFHVNDVAGSTATFTDGTITLAKPNSTGSSVTDFVVCGNSGTVTSTGGFIQFGDNSSGSNLIYTFKPHSNVSLPNLLVSGPVANAATLQPSASSTDDIKAISIHIEPGKTFDVRSVSGTTGDSRMVILTGNYDGINSLFCDGILNSRSSTLVLQGGEGQQIAGTGTLELYHLEIDNSIGSTLGIDLTVNGTLSLSNGILYSTSSDALTIASTGTISGGSASSYVDGPLIRNLAAAGTSTLDFPIGKDGAFRPFSLNLTQSSAAQAVYTVELINASPRNFGYSLPGSIDRVSAMRYYAVSRSGAANLTALSSTIAYDSDDGVTDAANLRLVHDNGSGTWMDLGGSGSGAGSGTISSS